MKKTYVLAFTAITFWSTVSVTTKLLLKDFTNFQVLWISTLFAAVGLLFVNLFTGQLKVLKTYTFKDFIRIALIGLPGLFFYYVFFYAGSARMPASQAFIVNYLWPIMSVLCACLILKEKMTLKKGVALGMSFLGVVIVMWHDLFAFEQEMLIGAGLCVMGAVSYGLFTALNQKYQYNKRVSMMISYVVTFVLTGIINAVQGNLFLPTLTQSLGFAWNGMFTMAFAGTAWITALESGETAKISNLAYITPFLSLVWTTLILHETVQLNFIIGLVMIVLGIFVQMFNTKKLENSCR